MERSEKVCIIQIERFLSLSNKAFKTINMPIQPSKRLQLIPLYLFKEINDKVAELKKMADAGKVATNGGRTAQPIDFGVGDPSEPTPNFVIESLTEAGRKHATTGYPSYIGSREFREAACRYMKRRFGVMLDPEKEVSSNIGSKEAIFNFPEAFVEPGDIVICPSPGYPPMKTGTVFAEGVPYYAPLLEKNGFLLDYEAIPEDVVRRAKIIWINYPNSPTGAVADKNYYKGLIEWARKNEIIIAADEGCYIDIYLGNVVPISILQAADEFGLGREGIVAFYSLSKRNNMTGYRVGFVAGGEDVVKIFKLLKTNIDSGTSSIIQEAAIKALDDDAHVSKMRRLYEQKAEILLKGLKDIGLEVKKPAATFYIWQKVPDRMTDIEFAKKLLDPMVAIVVTPGSLIADECEGVNPGAGYVRFALRPTIKEIEDAVVRLKKLQNVV